jgi:hypothetical protein
MYYWSLTKYFLILLLFEINTIGTGKSYAQQDTIGKKFYAGVEMGASGLLLSQNNLEGNRSASYVLGFYGGYIPFRALRIGINLNGYLIESFGNFYESPEKGVSISNVQGQLQVLPFRTVHIFANMQGGWSTYTNHHPNDYNSNGFAGKAGLGYEYGFGKRLFVSLLFNYSTGKFNDVKYPGLSITNQHFNAYEIVANLTYR